MREKAVARSEKGQPAKEHLVSEKRNTKRNAPKQQGIDRCTKVRVKMKGVSN
jgi:hypothetical protein